MQKKARTTLTRSSYPDDTYRLFAINCGTLPSGKQAFTGIRACWGLDLAEGRRYGRASALFFLSSGDFLNEDPCVERATSDPLQAERVRSEPVSPGGGHGCWTYHRETPLLALTGLSLSGCREAAIRGTPAVTSDPAGDAAARCRSRWTASCARSSGTPGAPARYGGRRHQGIDILAPRGRGAQHTEGIIEYQGDARPGRAGGDVIGPGGYRHYYAHLEDVAAAGRRRMGPAARSSATSATPATRR